MNNSLMQCYDKKLNFRFMKTYIKKKKWL